MCFHTSTTHKTKKLEAYFKVKLNTESIRPIFDIPNYHLNGFSHPNMLIIPQEKSQVLAPGVWGIVPSNKKADEIKDYYKEAVKYGGGLNARSEKLFQHYMYRESVMTKRCIIPVNGFYEPHEHKKKKYPFYIQGKDKEPLALAGIYSVIDTYITFSILTKAASPLFEKIHNTKKRQPVIIDAEHIQNWLSKDLSQEEIITILDEFYPEDKLDAYTVSKDLFSPKVDSNTEAIIEKVEYAELNEVF
ncbi:putative SOS response-associated peptidase YedK [Mariniflexile fucanivorans]|uniref:Abasic site processing protein n=1 Tax=Mariniflexile fucanivorans TaxID=264023 RepID=A0A4R1RNR1_9FLAO|nr:SOS response-associated peptidase [Mariniflexile fucanivorans]TCL67809.1 putative SOS response-associated peptidase YedK [Mariniflexile fucanivorans]